MGNLQASARAEEQASPSAGTCLVYVGTYTGGKSQGIYAYRLDLASGECAPLGLAAAVKNPSFLAVHPSRKYVYSVNELEQFGGKPAGGLSAFAIDPNSGKLTLIN